MNRKGQQGFTLVELLIVIAITALIIPSLGAGIYQMVKVPSETSAALTASRDVSFAAECITKDANRAQEFYEPVNPLDPDSLEENLDYLPYGTFSWWDEDLVAHAVQYCYKDNHNLVREERAQDSVEVKSLIVAGGIENYGDVSFTLSEDENEIIVTIKLAYEGEENSITFHARLRRASSSAWKYRIPITIANTSEETLDEYQVLVTLDQNFNYSHANPDGSDIRFYGDEELGYWIEYWSSNGEVTIPVYELPIEIDLSESTSDLTDYQVKVEITDTNILSHVVNGSDLRFHTTQPENPYQTDGLSYWIEELTEGKLTVWVKAPSIPTTGTTIYMYYGNPYASPKSDGDATFEFFDNFESGNLDKWTTSQDGVIEISKTQVYSGQYSVRIYHTSGGSWDTYIGKTIDMSNKSFESRIYYKTNTAQGVIAVVGDGDWVCLGEEDESNPSYWCRLGDEDQTYHGTRISGWDKLALIITDSAVKYYARDTYLTEKTGAPAKNEVQIGGWWEGKEVEIWADNVIVREYADPEPTASAGTEVQKALAPVGARIWVKVPSIPAYSTQTVYMYYGNPEEDSESSVSDTFDSATFTDTFTDTTKIDMTDSTNITVALEEEVETTSTTETYDFSDITAPSSTHVARYDNDDDTLEPATEFDDLTEFTTAEYSNIAQSDDTGALHASNIARKTQHVFRFKLEMPETSINNFTVTWEGYSNWFQSEGVRIWNSATSDWDAVGDVPLSIEDTISELYTTNISNYIDDNGYLFLMAYTEYVLYTDYVKLEVDYTCYKSSGTLRSVAIPMNEDTRFAVGTLFSWNDTEPEGTDIKYQLEYSNDGGTTWHLIPDFALAGNSEGFDESPINVSAATPTYEQIRLRANLSTTDAAVTPNIQDWTLTYYHRKYAAVEESTMLITKTYIVDAAGYSTDADTLKTPSTFDSLSEFDEDRYNAIAESDNIVAAIGSVWGKKTQQVFRFKLDVPEEDIIGLTVTYKGGSTFFPQREGIRIWNKLAEDWEVVGNTSFFRLLGRNQVSKSFTTNIDDLIDDNGYLFFTAYSQWGFGVLKLKTDYVEVKVTYQQSSGSLTAYVNPETSAAEEEF